MRSGMPEPSAIHHGVARPAAESSADWGASCTNLTRPPPLVLNCLRLVEPKIGTPS
jgi:hypothetical protein